MRALVDTLEGHGRVRPCDLLDLVYFVPF
ncbi:hypothetical protein F383_28601 [Gossypium arboreum]|uniref:Uncharacterized protein n=1 Tax=Gossypium arboreum TaxID=29729 RepID=A0A0B0MPG9_GOSAR|nr:hypothetical protein F383_28601 [Gossypium arboreum]